MDSTPNPLEQLTLDQLRARTSAKWQAFGENVLPLWVAEMDVTLAEPVVEELHRTAQLGDTGYPMPRRYAEALAGFASARWDWEPSVAHMRVMPDVMRGAVEALKLVTGPGDAVVVNSPVYPPFFMYPATAGRQLVESPLGEDGRIDLAGLEETFRMTTSAASTAGGRGGGVAYLLCNPHNPTGVVHTRDELEQVAALADRCGVRVIADEIHAPLMLPAETDDVGREGLGPQFTPYLTVDPSAFSLMSATKAWNLAGLKAALLIAGEHAVGDLHRLPKDVAQGPSHLGVLTQTSAYAHGGEWLDALLAGLAANRVLLGELLAEHLPQVRWTAPEATYLAWLDFSGYPGMPGIERDAPTPGVEAPMQGPAKHLVRQADVVLTPGHPFGSGGQRRARLNFATSQAILTEAVERMGSALTAA